MADDTKKLKTGADLAEDALEAGDTPAALPKGDEVNEIEASDELAESIGYLQNIIERNANQLMEVKEKMKLKREELRSVFENDAQLNEAEETLDVQKQQVKERRSQITNSPQATSLKTDISEINEEKKELEETLSNHLLNYYALTNSKSFDTSDGDQWEFNIKARVKSRKS